MAVRINHAPQVAGLHLEMERTLAFIDDALDRKWSTKWRSLSERLSTLLAAIART